MKCVCFIYIMNTQIVYFYFAQFSLPIHANMKYGVCITIMFDLRDVSIYCRIIWKMNPLHPILWKNECACQNSQKYSMSKPWMQFLRYDIILKSYEKEKFWFIGFNNTWQLKCFISVVILLPFWKIYGLHFTLRIFLLGLKYFCKLIW